MSAYEEYRREKQEIDEYLEQGYVFAGIREDLDGTEVRFVRKGTEAVEQALLLLLNPDSRKYVTALLFEGRQQIQAS